MDFKVVVPILGFNKCKEVSLERIDSIIYRLTDKNGSPTPSFTLISPRLLREDYSFELQANIVKKLQAKAPKDLEVLNIMIIDSPIENSYINFLAPLIFNKEKGLMGQIVLDSQKYPNFLLAEPLKKYLKKEG